MGRRRPCRNDLCGCVRAESEPLSSGLANGTLHFPTSIGGGLQLIVPSSFALLSEMTLALDLFWS